MLVSTRLWLLSEARSQLDLTYRVSARVRLSWQIAVATGEFGEHSALTTISVTRAA